MKLMLNGKEVTGMGHYVMAGDIKDATAEDSNVLSGKAYYNNNGKREGTMPNRGGMSAELAAGGSVSILEGYHNGEGVVRAQDLASQTSGDAGAGNIDSGKTAWVNGAQVTGTSTKVDTSGATATAGDIASGKTAWVNGSKVTGNSTAVNPSNVSIQLKKVGAWSRKILGLKTLSSFTTEVPYFSETKYYYPDEILLSDLSKPQAIKIPGDGSSIIVLQMEGNNLKVGIYTA